LNKISLNNSFLNISNFFNSFKIEKTRKLSNGLIIPSIGSGSNENTTEEIITSAYKNETEVGKGI